MPQSELTDPSLFKFVYHPAPVEKIFPSPQSSGRSVSLEELATNLYHTVGVTYDMMRIHGADEDNFHAVEILDPAGETRHIIFFQIRSRAVVVTNLFVPLDHDLAQRFSEFVFRTFKQILWIEWPNCKTLPSATIPYTIQRLKTNYYVRDLPDDFEIFLKSIGQNANQNYRRYLKKSQKDLALEISIFKGEELTRADFDVIMGLKNKQLERRASSPLFESFLTPLFRTHQKYGLTVYLTSRNRLVAAYLVTIAGKGCEFWTTAYDEEFSKYWLGNLSGMEAIRAAIGRGCHEFNFLWGLTDHKLMLGGQPQAMMGYTIARNGPAYVMAFILIAVYRPAMAFVVRGKNFLLRRLKIFVRRIFKFTN